MVEHNDRRIRTAAGMVATFVLTMVEIIGCANFGNLAIQYEELGNRLNNLTLTQIRKVGKMLGVRAQYKIDGKAITKAQLIDNMLTIKYGQGLSAPYFNFNGKMTDIDPTLQLNELGEFESADGILNTYAPNDNKLKSPFQRVPSFDYMDEATKAKNRVVTNEAGQAVSRRYSTSVKVPLLDAESGQFKTLKDGRIKLVRCELRVNKLVAPVNDEERFNGRVKTGSSNLRQATVLRQVIIENDEGPFLVWVAILQQHSHLIDRLTMPNQVSTDEVTKALEAVNTSWRFAHQVKEASKPNEPICEAYSSKDSVCTIDEPHQCLEGEERRNEAHYPLIDVGMVNHPLDPRLEGNYSNKVMKQYRQSRMKAIKEANAWRTHTFNNGGE